MNDVTPTAKQTAAERTTRLLFETDAKAQQLMLDRYQYRKSRIGYLTRDLESTNDRLKHRIETDGLGIAILSERASEVASLTLQLQWINRWVKLTDDLATKRIFAAQAEDSEGRDWILDEEQVDLRNKLIEAEAGEELVPVVRQMVQRDMTQQATTHYSGLASSYCRDVSLHALAMVLDRGPLEAAE